MVAVLGAQAPSLAGGLQSHRPWDMAQKKRKKLYFLLTFLLPVCQIYTKNPGR